MKNALLIGLAMVGILSAQDKTNASIIPTAGTAQTFNVTTGDIFYDTGGAGGCLCSNGCANNYVNSNSQTNTTLCPTVAGNKVSLQFTQFAMWNTTSIWDWMVVWDNNAASGTVLWRNDGGAGSVHPYGDCGTDPGFTVTASAANASGCLHVRFFATSVVNRLGWLANITTNPLFELNIADIKGTSQNGTNLIQWSVDGDASGYTFHLERSADAQRFIEIGRTEVVSQTGFTYAIPDLTPLETRQFYRVVMESPTGELYYSNQIEMAGTIVPAFRIESVYPQPADQDLTLNLNVIESGTVKLRFINAIGQVVMERTAEVGPGVNPIQLQTGDLTSGMYHIQVMQGGKSLSTPLVIE